MSCVSNVEFQLLTLGNPLGIVAEAVQELSLHSGFLIRLFLLLTQLLELKSLQVDLFEAFHAWIVLDGTLECALGDFRESCQRLNLKVASVDKLVNVFLVDLLKFFFESSVIFGHLKVVWRLVTSTNSTRDFRRCLLLSLFLSGRSLVSQVVDSLGFLVV